MYYSDKLLSLQQIFGTSDIQLEQYALVVSGSRYPIVDDVIILTDEVLRSPEIFAKDIQETFGKEWQAYAKIEAQHQSEFLRYFDLVDLHALSSKRVCDLGCGNGRHSFFLKDLCRELVLVDFSDAIFVARKNLASASHCLFFKCDIKRLPFVENFTDLLFCLGVLHHLPTPCLDEVRALKRTAPEILIYLYYALDNRPWHFRAILWVVTRIRLALSLVTSPRLRKAFAVFGSYAIYLPFVTLGRLLKPFGFQHAVPLYDGYHDKNMKQIEQDVYDRFFTRIEQRVSRVQIETLRDTFAEVRISDQLPYWHFVCRSHV